LPTLSVPFHDNPFAAPLMKTSRFLVAWCLGVVVCLAMARGIPAQVAPAGVLQSYTVTGTVVLTYEIRGKWQGVLVKLPSPLFIEGKSQGSIDIDASGRPLEGLMGRKIMATGPLEVRLEGKRKPYWVLVPKDFQVLDGK